MYKKTMHHQAVKSNLGDLGTERKRVGSGKYDQPLCPKPVRLSPAVPEFLKPIRCSKHRFDSSSFNGTNVSFVVSFCELASDLLILFFTSQPIIDEGNGVLNMITEKVLVLFKLINK